MTSTATSDVTGCARHTSCQQYCEPEVGGGGGGGEKLTIIIDVHVPAVGCDVVAVGYPVDVAACSDINVVAC